MRGRSLTRRCIGRDEILGAWRESVDSGELANVLLRGDYWNGTTALLQEMAAIANAAGWKIFEISGDAALTSVPLGALALAQPVDSAVDAEQLLLAARDLGGDETLIAADRADLLDDATLALVAARAPVVATVRTAPAAFAAFERVEVAPFDANDVAELGAELLGQPVSRQLAHQLHAASGGRPGAVAALVRAALAAGVIACDRDMWIAKGALPTPAEYLDVSRATLRSLDPDDHDTLVGVALTGPVELAAAPDLFGTPALDRLDERGLLALADGHVVIADPILARAVLDACPALRRAGVARALAKRLDGQSDLPSVSLVLELGRDVEPERALDLAARALALRRAELTERLARAAYDRHPTPRAAQTLAEALTLIGRNHEAEQVLARGANTGTKQEQALAAMSRATNLFYHLNRADDALSLLEDAALALAGTDWADELDGMRAVLFVFLGAPRRALEIVGTMLDSREGRPFAQAATAAAPALIALGQHDHAADIAQRGFEARLALGDQAILTGPGIHLVARSMALGESGDFDEADALSTMIATASIEAGDADGQMWAGTIAGKVHLDRARYADAARTFGETAVIAEQLNSVAHLIWARAGIGLALGMRRDLVALPAALDDLARLTPTPIAMFRSEVLRARAWAAIAGGDLLAGRRLLVAAADDAAATEQYSMELVALHDLTRVGDGALTSRTVDVASRVEGALASARASHAAAFAVGDADDLLGSAARFRSLGAFGYAAEAAMQAAAAAQAAGDVHGSDGAARQAEHDRAHTQGMRTPALARNPGVHELTTREYEIAHLAASGLSSKLIARRLSLSPRTIDNLLHRAYRKLDVSSRDDLPAALG